MHIGVKVQRLNLQHEATRPLIEFFVYLSIKSWRLFIEGVLFFPAGWESFPGRPRWRVHQRVHHSHESNPLQAHLEQERRRRGPQSRGDKTSFFPRTFYFWWPNLNYPNLMKPGSWLPVCPKPRHLSAVCKEKRCCWRKENIFFSQQLILSKSRDLLCVVYFTLWLLPSSIIQTRIVMAIIKWTL